MRRCTHENQKSHIFKSGEAMWLCRDCGAGGGHYDQSTPILGKLFRKGGIIDTAEESVPEELEIESEIDSELAIPTFAALAHESRRVPNTETKTPPMTQNQQTANKVRRSVKGCMTFSNSVAMTLQE